MTLAELIDRLERATEGSRELDAEIMIACALVPRYEFGLADGWSYEYEILDRGYVYRWPVNPSGQRGGVSHGRVAAPLYTLSVDAALTLVPEGAWFEMEHVRKADGTRTCAAAISHAFGEYPHGETYAPTFPLAISLAAMRARLAMANRLVPHSETPPV